MKFIKILKRATISLALFCMLSVPVFAGEDSTTCYTPNDFMFQGVIYYDGFRFTWYSQQVLPGGGLDIPGRHVDELGYVCDENDFICVASCDYAKGTIIDTPFGKQGKVYDVCGISGTIDIYVNW